MTALQWRTASDLRLIAKIIPDPRNPAELLDRLTDVLVAGHGRVLYVDPRQQSDRDRPGVNADVYAIPSASVVFLTYR
jgi:hypothetical protein